MKKTRKLLVLGWEPVEIDPLEAFIYKGSRGVLPEKRYSRKRD